jgi:hypothetical protein
MSQQERLALIEMSKMKAVRNYFGKGLSSDLLRGKSFPFLSESVTVSIRAGELKIHVRDGLMHNHCLYVKDYNILLCPFLKRGDVAEIKYVCHADNLPEPSVGKLTIEGI